MQNTITNKSTFNHLIFTYTSLGYILLTIFIFSEYNRIGDFRIFLMASKDLSSRIDLYSMSYISGFHYYYSPLFATLLYPFTKIPPQIIGLLWNSLSIILLWRTTYIFNNYFLKSYNIDKKLTLFALFAISFPLYATLHMTQMSIFILYAIIESLYRIIKTKQKLLGALLLALAINIKILPIVFIAYLIYRNELKATLYVILFTALYLFIPSLVLGTQYNNELISSWCHIINPLNTLNTIDLDERGFHSITSLISALLTDQIGPYELHLKRNICNLNTKTVAYCINFIRLAFVLFTLHFLKKNIFKKENNKLKLFWEISYICLVIPLIFPHQQTYGFLLLFPAMYYITFYILNIKKSLLKNIKIRTIYITTFLSVIIINLELLLGEYRNYYWHFKTLTYGAVLLSITLALCNPNKIKSQLTTTDNL